MLFSFFASSAVTVAAKFESLPRAFASSFSVFSCTGAPLTRAEMDLATNSVLAMALLLFPSLAVGTEVVPVKAASVAVRVLVVKLCSARDFFKYVPFIVFQSTSQTALSKVPENIPSYQGPFFTVS